MSNALCPIVDENDVVIDYKHRLDITNKDIYRVSALSIINSHHETLMTQRVLTKKHNPGQWQAAVAGTVEKGESYLENIIKETQEEIGLNISKLDFKPLKKFLVK